MPSGAASRHKKRIFFRTALLQLLDGCGRRVRCCQHRVNRDDQSVRQVAGSFVIIFDGLKRLMVAIKPDMRDSRRRHQIEHAFQQSISGAQYGSENQLLALQHRCIHRLHRGFNGLRCQFQIACHLVAKQQRNLPQQPPEGPRRGLLVAHDRELVLHQRVIDYGDAVHERLLTDG